MAQSEVLSHNLPSAPCAVCGAAGKPCARCRLDYYCGKAHQTAHWARHKAGCGVLEVRTDAVLGRHVVLAKDVPKGTVLLREVPAVVGFTTEHDNMAVCCVGCARALAPLGGVWRGCSRCGWPVCGQQCADGESHRGECKEFQRACFRLRPEDMSRPQAAIVCWSVLNALRVLLASKGNPRILALQSETKPGRDVEVGVMETGRGDDHVHGHVLCVRSRTMSLTNSKEVINFVRDNKQLKLNFKEFQSQWLGSAAAKRVQLGALRTRSNIATWLTNLAGLKGYTKEELLRASGILDVNGIGLEYESTSTVYVALSMLEHNCRPSAFTMPAKGDLFVVAARQLRRGDHLSICYTQGSDCSLSRRLSLCTWGFLCRCERCADPTEDGLHLGSLCCPACSAKGRQSRLVSREGAWRCPACPHSMDAAGYMATAKAVADSWHQARDGAEPGRPESLRAFIRNSLWPRGALHPTHYLVLHAKLLLAQFSFSMEGTEDDLLRQIAVLDDVRTALDAISPGSLDLNRHNVSKMIFQLEYCRSQFLAEPFRRHLLRPWVAKMEGLREDLRSLPLINPN